MSSITFFGYGSMSEGMVHFDKISKFVLSTQTAYVFGSVYRLAVGFPVLLNQGQQEIKGTLFEMEANHLLLNLLDEFHGFDPIKPENSFCYRGEAAVFSRSKHGEEMIKHDQVAFAYFINPSKLPRSAALIIDGDWEKSLKERPAMTSILTSRQKSYIRRLGSSSGRDIIPIDLDLYRELMNLEIIRDKGRRLALTKYGKEVFRYLD